MTLNTKITLQDISKSYRMYDRPLDRVREAFSSTQKAYHTDFFALSDISFSVSEGEILGIMGRNGAGKSTLLKVITGILKPTSGHLQVAGRISSLLELGAGFNMEYTGKENIYFYCTLMGLSKNEIDNCIDDIIDFAEIGDYIGQPVKTYSSGMFARLAFSCAINVSPDILIVDEILSVGDLRFQAKCFNKFKEFKKSGVTILYVGHDISTMRTFCDRCVWLNNGRVVDIGDPTYISAKYTEFMYLDDIAEFTEYKSSACQEKEKTKNSDVTICVQDDILEEIMLVNDIVPERTTDHFEEARAKNIPLAHWGKKTGLIYDVCFILKEQEITGCSPYDLVTISFKVHYDAILDYEYLSAAFSIKDREGIDLVVKTTYDEKIKIVKTGNSLEISFTQQLRLTNGEYYLVLALEDRKGVAIQYYEYIEGVKYFKVFDKKAAHGKFIVDSVIKIR